MTPQSQLDRLRTLLSAATAAPWVADDANCDLWGAFDADGNEIVYAIDPSRYRKHDGDGKLDRDKENIALIVALRNGADELLDEVERLRSLLAGIKWRSADRDNMEFAATITCFQMDKIRAALHPKQERDDAAG